MNNNDMLYTDFQNEVKNKFIKQLANIIPNEKNNPPIPNEAIEQYHVIKAIINNSPINPIDYIPKYILNGFDIFKYLADEVEDGIKYTIELIAINPKYKSLFDGNIVILQEAKNRLKPYADKLTDEQKEWLE